MAQTFQLADVLAWRLAGAAFWLGAIGAASTACWALAPPSSLRLLLFPSQLTSLLLLWALQCGVLVAHRMVMATTEPQPLYVPRLGVHGRSWVSLVMTRLLLRGRRWVDAAAVAALVGSTSASAVLHLYLLGNAKAGGGSMDFGLSFWLGVALGTTYSVWYLVGGRDILSYPELHRHRFYTLKKKWPDGLATAAGIVLRALLASMLVLRVLPPLAGVYSGGLAAVLCVFGWVMGSALLAAIYTERLQLAAPGDADPNGQLLAGLNDTNPILQDLALRDLSEVATGSGGAALWRRAAIFEDETGRAAWSPLTTYALVELQDFTRTLAAALPAIAGDTAASARGPAAGPAFGGMLSGVQWNATRLSPVTGVRQVSRDQDLAAWHVRNRFYRVRWASRTLSGLAAAAQRGEDCYGVVLLCDPNLADMVAALAALALALQAYSKHLVSMRPRHPPLVARVVSSWLQLAVVGPPSSWNHSLRPVEALAYALEAEARRCLVLMAGAYGGERLRHVVKDARAKPAFGAAGDVAAFVARVCSFEE